MSRYSQTLLPHINHFQEAKRKTAWVVTSVVFRFMVRRKDQTTTGVVKIPLEKKKIILKPRQICGRRSPEVCRQSFSMAAATLVLSLPPTLRLPGAVNERVNDRWGKPSSFQAVKCVRNLSRDAFQLRSKAYFFKTTSPRRNSLNCKNTLKILILTFFNRVAQGDKIKVSANMQPYSLADREEWKKTECETNGINAAMKEGDGRGQEGEGKVKSCTALANYRTHRLALS